MGKYLLIKNHMQKRTLFLLAIFFCLQACGSALSNGGASSDGGADADAELQHSGWVNFPVSIYIDSGFSSDQSAAIQSAMATWENALGQKLFTLLTPYQGMESGASEVVYDLTPGAFMNSNENGLIYAFTDTSYEPGEGSLNAATIYVNSQSFQWVDSMSLTPETSDSSAPLADTESVAVHEIGHFLGLGHISGVEDPESVMNPSIIGEIGYAKRRLSQMDIERVRSFYHLDTSPSKIASAFQAQTGVESITSAQVRAFQLQKNCLELFNNYGAAAGGIYPPIQAQLVGASTQFSCANLPQNVLSVQ